MTSTVALVIGVHIWYVIAYLEKNRIMPLIALSDLEEFYHEAKTYDEMIFIGDNYVVKLQVVDTAVQCNKLVDIAMQQTKHQLIASLTEMTLWVSLYSNIVVLLLI